MIGGSIPIQSIQHLQHNQNGGNAGRSNHDSHSDLQYTNNLNAVNPGEIDDISTANYGSLIMQEKYISNVFNPNSNMSSVKSNEKTTRKAEPQIRMGEDHFKKLFTFI